MATRRNPSVAKGEKAAITKAARDVTKEVNEAKQRIKELEQALGDKERMERHVEKSRERRKRNNASAQLKRRRARSGVTEKRKCHGLNLVGQPCGQSPLLPERWDGPEEISGLYCIHHEPAIDDETRTSFQLLGTAKSKAYRRVTPGELAHRMIQDAPHHFLRPYLKSLGLELDPETKEIRKVGQGLKLHGYSRGGEVVRSPYPDYAGQVQVVEKLLDRIYGKARQAVDLAAQNTTVSVNLTMDESRIEKVAQVLQQAGALPLPNGNGNGDSPKVIDAEAVELPMEEID